MLNLDFDIDCVGRLDFEGNLLAIEDLGKESYTATEMKDKMDCGFLWRLSERGVVCRQKWDIVGQEC
jgi:hypothetical protein